jgi:hypothetical protein
MGAQITNAAVLLRDARSDRAAAPRRLVRSWNPAGLLVTTR